MDPGPTDNVVSQRPDHPAARRRRPPVPSCGGQRVGFASVCLQRRPAPRARRPRWRASSGGIPEQL